MIRYMVQTDSIAPDKNSLCKLLSAEIISDKTIFMR